MERLTDCAQGYCEVYCDRYTSCFSEPETCERKHEIQLYERLKDYESTGLAPDEVFRLKNDKMVVVDLAMDGSSDDVRHLRDLLKAEAEGRLVVLPCKVGDTVFRLITPKDGPASILECQVKTMGQAADLAGRIGKKRLLISVYATREEAEAALEGVNHE